MTQEEKAKAYDEAIKIINDYYQKIKYSSFSCASNDREILERAFPQIKESEDERIRKELITIISCAADNSSHIYMSKVDSKRYITWLEKQGEQKPAWSEKDELYIRELESLVKQVWATAEHENDKDKIHKMSDLSFFLKTLKPQLKQGEQKHIEPNWVHHKVDLSGNSEEYIQAYYDGWNNCNQQHSQLAAEQKPTKWTMDNVDELTEFENAMMHIGNSFFGKNAGLDPNDTNAIKEQANILLGLVPKQEWSEEDEHWKQKAIDFMKHPDLIKATPTLAKNTIEWLKSLKVRVQPKQEWSDEDEEIIKNIIEVLIHVNGTINAKVYEKEISFLKSLKDKYTWKPNDKQLEALKSCVGKTWFDRDTLRALLEQLKKLRNE